LLKNPGPHEPRNLVSVGLISSASGSGTRDGARSGALWSMKVCYGGYSRKPVNTAEHCVTTAGQPRELVGWGLL